jgi:hypothetical protein
MAREKRRLCPGCIYDRDHINAKLLLLLAEILTSKLAMYSKTGEAK